jgi:hypothetical protein
VANHRKWDDEADHARLPTRLLLIPDLSRLSFRGFTAVGPGADLDTLLAAISFVTAGHP